MVKAKFKIGSVHGRIMYGRDEKVFHRSDMPAAAQVTVRKGSNSSARTLMFAD